MNATNSKLNIYEKIVSIFLLVLGVSIIGVWALLFITKKVEIPVGFEQSLGMYMHLGSELLLAFLALLTGMYLLYSSPKAQCGLFFTIGLAVGSTFNAFIYYTIVELDIMMAVIIGSFFILSSAAFISGLFFSTREMGKHRVMYKSGLFLLGLLVYYLLNIAANFAVPGSWHFFGQASLFVIIISAYSAALIGQTNDIAIG